MESNVKTRARGARNSSIELLRSISAFIIVITHFATHGGFDFALSELTIPLYWWYLIEMGGYLGVSCFVLIAGYFLSTSAKGKLNARNIFKFFGQLIFYAVSIYLILCIIGAQQFNIKKLMQAFFPVTMNTWWYAGAYISLYLVHPFINQLIHTISRRTYRNLIVGFIGLWCIIPTVTQYKNQYNEFIWFITLYLVAGYIRMYGLNPKFTVRHYALFFAASSLLRYASAIIIAIASTRLPSLSEFTLILYERNSPLTFLSAVSLFMMFEKMHTRSSRVINTIASASFGVYLIHDNPMIRDLLWTRIFNAAAYQYTPMIIPYSVFAAACIFICCTAIDLLRQYVLERPYMHIVDRYSPTWLRPFRAAIRFVQNIVFGDIPNE